MSGELAHPRYDAVLFDFDGVLADSEPEHFRCWAEVLEPHGIQMDWDTYVRHGIGLSDRDLLKFLATRASRVVSVETLLAEYPRKQELFRSRMLAAPPICPATIDLLRTMNGYRLGLVTSTNRAEVEPVLRQAGIFELFGATVFGEDVSAHKPAPDPYLEAALRLAIRRALVVEDSEAGAASGRAAGFDVVKIRHPRETAEAVRFELDMSRFR